MTSPSATATKSSSFIEDIVDVFHAPSAVFERRRNAGYGAALVLYAVLTAVMLYAARPVMRPVFERQMDRAVAQMNQNPNIPAEQREAMATRIRGMIDSPFALAVPMVFIPLSIFVGALALWLAGKAFGSSATYGQAAMVFTFAQFPRLLVSAVLTGLAIATGREVTNQFGLTLSPAALLPEDASPVMAALASRVDLGTLWTTALLGIGLAVVGRIARGKGLAAAAIVWLLGGLFFLVTALREVAAAG
jgi:hypothetical protein